MAYAKGKYAKAICDRCGWKYPYLKMRTEQGTKLTVCSECYDGAWDRVLHPQNYPPKKLIDGVAIKDPMPDVPLSDLEVAWIADQNDVFVVDQNDEPIGDGT